MIGPTLKDQDGGGAYLMCIAVSGLGIPISPAISIAATITAISNTVGVLRLADVWHQLAQGLQVLHYKPCTIDTGVSLPSPFHRHMSSCGCPEYIPYANSNGALTCRL